MKAIATRTGAADARAAAAKRDFDPFRYDRDRADGMFDGIAEAAANGSYREAIKLHCLQCIGWDPKEAKACSAPQCGLWVANRKIFRARRGGSDG